MTYKTVRKRVADGFDSSTMSEFGVEYLKLIADRSSDIGRALRRTGSLIVLLGVAFTLLVDAKQAEVAVGPLKITNVAAVLTLIPTILSFLFYELVVLVYGAGMYRQILTDVAAKMYPALEKNDLEQMLGPATASLWGQDYWRNVRAVPPGKASKALDVLDVGVAVAIVAGSLVFGGFAFRSLYGNPHVSDVAVTIAMAIALFNLARALLFIQDGDKAFP